MLGDVDRLVRIIECGRLYQWRGGTGPRVKFVILDCSWAVVAAHQAIASGWYSDVALRVLLAARRVGHDALVWT